MPARLTWDSTLFGFEVGIIEAPNLDDSRLEKELLEARAMNLALVYWCSEDGRRPAEGVCNQFCGKLVGRRVRYGAPLDQLVRPSWEKYACPCLIREYPKGPACDALLALAMDAGQQSRFKVDARFPDKVFRQLYHTWIQNSTQRQIADTVLTAIDAKNRIVGMVTLSSQDDECRIGLIAVDHLARSVGVGGCLVNAAHDWMAAQGASFASVITQEANSTACRFYERCGYGIREVNNHYHFWLDKID